MHFSGPSSLTCTSRNLARIETKSPQIAKLVEIMPMLADAAPYWSKLAEFAPNSAPDPKLNRFNKCRSRASTTELTPDELCRLRTRARMQLRPHGKSQNNLRCRSRAVSNSALCQSPIGTQRPKRRGGAGRQRETNKRKQKQQTRRQRQGEPRAQKHEHQIAAQARTYQAPPVTPATGIGIDPQADKGNTTPANCAAAWGDGWKRPAGLLYALGFLRRCGATDAKPRVGVARYCGAKMQIQARRKSPHPRHGSRCCVH